jgi:CreA protein
MRSAALLAATLLFSAAAPALAEEVGSFRNDWTGNSIVIEAIADPKVQGVTCHLTHFERSLIDCPRGTGSSIPRTRRSPAARPGRSRSATSTRARAARRCSPSESA